MGRHDPPRRRVTGQGQITCIPRSVRVLQGFQTRGYSKSTVSERHTFATSPAGAGHRGLSDWLNQHTCCLTPPGLLFQDSIKWVTRSIEMAESPSSNTGRTELPRCKLEEAQSTVQPDRPSHSRRSAATSNGAWPRRGGHRWRGQIRPSSRSSGNRLA